MTGQALALAGTLAGWGFRTQVFAEHVHPSMRGTVRSLDAFAPGIDDRVILRYSISSAATGVALGIPAERLGIIYHNITPGHLLASTNPALAALCDRGRQELSHFRGRVAVTVADSSYNAEELESMGFHDPVVVPLLLRFPDSQAPTRTSHEVLTVGRIVPSKRLEDVVQAFAVLRRHLLPTSRLTVIGGWQGFETYRSALGAYANRLGVADQVSFTGVVSDDDRDDAYRRAGALLSMSEHEGFCVPLLEALAAGLPVVARTSGAVEETLGGAGLLVRRRDPVLAAEALARVLTDEDLRDHLRTRGTRRLEEVSMPVVEGRLRSALEPLLR